MSRIRIIDVLVVLHIVVFVGYKGMSGSSEAPPGDPTFAERVDLTPLYETAVQYDGRLRSFESHAQSMVGLISGSRKIDDQSFGFTYLDLIFRPETYPDRKMIYVKNKMVRARIGDVLRQNGNATDEEVDTIIKRGMFSRTWLETPGVMRIRDELSRDLIRTARTANEINSAIDVSNRNVLQGILKVVPPEGANLQSPWASVTELLGPPGLPSDGAHAALASAFEGVSNELSTGLRDEWKRLATAWRAENVDDVNNSIASLATLFRQNEGEVYPSEGRLRMESWYFRTNSMTWVWLIYLLSVLPLLMSLIYKWDRARLVGMVMFVIAFALHTASLMIRWYISGRWPNANMFEAVTTSAWFGGVGALILEFVTRRTAYRNIFALGSAVISMVSLMALQFLPAYVDSAIRNKMAALNDVWLYIHTNVIIWSYAVIGLACIPALLLLRHRWCTRWDDKSVPGWRLILLFEAFVLPLQAYAMINMPAASTQKGMITAAALVALCAAAGLVIILEAVAAWERGRAGASLERSAIGGAASLLASGAMRTAPQAGGSGGSPAAVSGSGPSPSQVFDGATMVLVEVAFIMLWTGTVMGAIWADHSWGRPWGWDPKEVFALNTFIIFVILIHVRFKVRDRALWTAWLAIIGFAVMLFNWIVVNFIITGLHSYA